MSTLVQLRIAARIHFLLKRDLGEGLNVAAMLSDPQEAREVLFVCQASGNPELVSLARQFINAQRLVTTAGGDAPQDAAWSRNTSGFGVLPPQPASASAALPAPAADAADAAAPAVERSSWRNATQWLRRASR